MRLQFDWLKSSRFGQELRRSISRAVVAASALLGAEKSASSFDQPDSTAVVEVSIVNRSQKKTKLILQSPAYAKASFAHSSHRSHSSHSSHRSHQSHRSSLMS
jgi:hypothetical protein